MQCTSHFSLIFLYWNFIIVSCLPKHEESCGCAPPNRKLQRCHTEFQGTHMKMHYWWITLNISRLKLYYTCTSGGADSQKVAKNLKLANASCYTFWCSCSNLPTNTLIHWHHLSSRTWIAWIFFMCRASHKWVSRKCSISLPFCKQHHLKRNIQYEDCSLYSQCLVYVNWNMLVECETSYSWIWYFCSSFRSN